MSSDELTLAVVAHLQSLQEDPANAGDRAEQLEVASQCLSDAFEIDDSTPPDFSLAEVYEAGINSLTGDAEAMSDAFAKFIHDVSQKGFFNSCESGSVEFEERFQRAKKKFFDKYKPSATPVPVPVPVTAAPSEEDKAAAQRAKLDGNEKLRANDLDGALEAYTKAIELDSTCAIFYANRAAVYTKIAGTENLELAVADCENAIKLDPSYTKAYSRLGLAYFHLGRYEEAVNKGYSKAVEADPENASAKKDLDNAKKRLAASQKSDNSASAAAAAPPTDPLAAMMAGLGGGGGGMPDMSSLMGMMQDPAIQQMAQQMMGGGGGGMPDLSGLMGAMGGAGASADAGAGPTVEEEPASDNAAGTDDGAELYDEDDDDGNDVSLAAEAEAEAEEQEAAAAAPATEDNPMSSMEAKIENNPRLKAIMEDVKRNPMAMMQHMNDPEVMSLIGDVMGMMGGGGGAGGNPLAAMMAQMGGGGAGGAVQPTPNVEEAEDMGEIS